jgi:membrane protein insertase Oxa1/YidC/SpoIIIJ
MKVTPQPTNNQPGMPDMKKIMFVMYIVFGFLSKDWPAGLLLYLVVSGFVGIAQQFVFSKNQVKVERLQEGVN